MKYLLRIGHSRMLCKSMDHAARIIKVLDGCLAADWIGGPKFEYEVNGQVKVELDSVEDHQVVKKDAKKQRE